MMLLNDGGEPQYVEEVKHKCVQYFSTLFAQLDQDKSYTPWYPRFITSDFNNWFIRLPKEDKVKKNMSPDKAPGQTALQNIEA